MPSTSQRELAFREQDGREIILLWDPRADEVSVELVDRRDESILRFPVAAEHALDAFHHPYAYALTSESYRAAAPVA